MSFPSKFQRLKNTHSFTISFLLFELFQRFIVENMANLESIKSAAESNFKMCLIINIQDFYDKDILSIFTVCLRVEKSLFLFPRFSIYSIMGKFDKHRFDYKLVQYHLLHL